MNPTTLNPIRDLIGGEHPLDHVNRTLRSVAQRMGAAAVGAQHVTCSDECERECCESLQNWFVQDLLPQLKFWSQSPFRTANLGGRYEWGSIPITEEHFATPATRDGFKLLLVKINAHVCVLSDGDDVYFGRMPRYDVDSVFCGALHAMLDGALLPAVDSLKEDFLSEGKDRIAILNDARTVSPSERGLLAAVAQARLQARRAVLDIQEHRPESPTYYVVLPCVTLNRPGPDTELVVGLYTADHRTEARETTYVGLGDDPSQYVVDPRHGRLQIDDPDRSVPRDARDHRRLLDNTWQRQEPAPLDDPSCRDEVVHLAARARDKQPSVANESIASLLGVMAVAAPALTAVELFVCGACGIHQFHRAYRLAHGTGTDDDARKILEDAMARIGKLPRTTTDQLIDQIAARTGISPHTT